MRDGDPGVTPGRQGCRDPGDDFERNPLGTERFDLVGRPREHRRIPTLEPSDTFSGTN